MGMEPSSFSVVMSKLPESFKLSRKGFSRLPQNDSSSEELELGIETKAHTVGRRWRWRDTSCCCLLLSLLVLVVLLAVGGGLLKVRLAKPSVTSIVLEVNTTLLERSGDWLTVSWEGVMHPSSFDWIGVYSPPINGGIDPTNHAPIKYQYASDSLSHLTEGRGSLQLRLINMRDDVIIGFFRNGLNASLNKHAEFNDPVVVALSDKIRFRNWNEPLQAHLALTGDPTEMILVWVTLNASNPQVKWGTQSGTYSFSKQASSNTYTAEDMCGSPAIDFGYRDAGLLHQVTMDRLTPGTQYFYTFGDTYGWSEEYSFRAAPEPGPNITTRVIAYGDMGVSNRDGTMAVLWQSQAPLDTSQLVQSQLNQTDVILHIGDISYAMGYASVWDDFFDEIQPIATQVPYMVCIGNHERDWANSGSYYNGTDSYGECGVPHERRFPMPRPSLDEAWYGFDYGSVHFVLMSTEHDFQKDSNQYRFLDSHLKNVNRSVTPWLVFAGHRPMYIDSNSTLKRNDDLPVASLLREHVEPLLKEYKVDLALWGHHHSYQRTCPVYKEVCSEGPTTHIVIGMGGMRHTLARSEKPNWIRSIDFEHWGYSRFTANATTLLFEFVMDSDGQVLDSVVLKKL